MWTRESRLADLHHCLTGEMPDGARPLMLENWAVDLTLDIASEALALLPCPLASLITGEVIRTWLHGAALRVRPLEPIDDLRLQWRGRAAGWSHRILLDGVREQAHGDALWRALLDAEALLRNAESETPTEHSVAAVLDHRSHHVRGFGWIGALQLHELGRPLALDLDRYAAREELLLRPIAAWVLMSTHQREVPFSVLDEALAETSPQRVQQDAVSLLRFVRPEAYRALAPNVARIAESDPNVWSVLCRINPEMWQELLPTAEETEPVVISEVTRRRREARGIRTPATQRTGRAACALMALCDAAAWLPEEAVTAIVSRAEDAVFLDVFAALGPRAHAAIPALRAAATPGDAHIRALVAIGGPDALHALDVLLTKDAKWATLIRPLGEDAVPLLLRHAPHLLRPFDSA